MRTLPKAKTWITLVLTLGVFALLVTEVARENPSNGPCRTEPLRQNLSQLRRVLGTLEIHLDSLHVGNECDRIAHMHAAVGLLKDYLLPHLAAEEAVLHPAVDRERPGPAPRLTDALRREHDILRRWLEEMERQADAPMPDFQAFARRGERLSGLIEAHFEVDEEILYPALDSGPSMTGIRARRAP